MGEVSGTRHRLVVAQAEKWLNRAMIAKLPPELVRELEQAGDQPLPVENHI